MASIKIKTDPRRPGSKPRMIAIWRGPSGKQVSEDRPNDTRKQALAYARERERLADLQVKGLEIEVHPVTFGALWDSWWKLVGSRRRSESKEGHRQSLEKHLTALRPFVLTPGSAGLFAAQLGEKLMALEDLRRGDDGAGLGPQSINHLRNAAFGMFENGSHPAVALWTGENPIKWVPLRSVPKKKQPTLEHHQVKPVLDALAEPKLGCPWRWAAAVCLYTGARPGEAFGLHKADVEQLGGARPVITFRSSWTAPTTKTKKDRQVAIVTELVPYLKAAIASSPGDLLFPRLDGKPFEQSLRHNLIKKLRRALVLAGVVLGFEHTCRRCKGKAKAGDQTVEVFTWSHPDNSQRECPACGMKLWAKGIPLPLGFKHLRHTTATLLGRGSAGLVTTQKTLGHSDPRMTANVYDQGDVEDRRAALERVLSFEPAESVGASWAQSGSPKNEGPGSGDFSRETEAFRKVGATGFEPATPCTPSLRRLERTAHWALRAAIAECCESIRAAPYALGAQSAPTSERPEGAGWAHGRDWGPRRDSNPRMVVSPGLVLVASQRSADLEPGGPNRSPDGDCSNVARLSDRVRSLVASYAKAGAR